MKFNAMKYRIPFLKRLIPSVKKRLFALRSHGSFLIGRSQGAYFLLNPQNFVDRQIYFYDDFEEHQVAALLNKMQKGADLFLDIGANIGFYSIIVAKHSATKRIVAFEADPRNILQLGANLLLNNLDARIEIVPKAVSSRVGKTKFRLGPANSTGQSMVDETADEFVSVDTITIDEFMDVRGKKIFAKIDIEGHELEAINGMSRLIANNDVFLQIECYRENIPELKRMLAALNMKYCCQIDHDFYFEKSSSTDLQEGKRFD